MPRSRIKLNGIAELAKECDNVNLKLGNVIEYLRSKGFSDPTGTWYDIRRWMKSNAPMMYRNIPLAMRIEIQPKEIESKDYVPPTETVRVQNKYGSFSTVKLYGQKEKDMTLKDIEERMLEPKAPEAPSVTNENVTPEEKAAMECLVPAKKSTVTEPAKKRGRKPGFKVENKPEKNSKKENRLQITELRSEKFTYCQRPGRGDANYISIQMNDGFQNSHDTLDLKKEAAIILRDELTEVIRTFFGEE